MEESRLRSAEVGRIDHHVAAWLAWSLCALSLVGRRIQSFIDRRFYRQKYDAARMLEAFSARLRDQTEPESLSGGLIGVVEETMQPEHIPFWVRSSTASWERRTRRWRCRVEL